MPEGGERRRNLTTTGLGEKTRPRVKRDRGATQSPTTHLPTLFALAVIPAPTARDLTLSGIPVGHSDPLGTTSYICLIFPSLILTPFLFPPFSTYSPSFRLSSPYEHFPRLATALAVIPAPTVGAWQALHILLFFFLASSLLLRAYPLILWPVSSPLLCALSTLVRPPSLSVPVPLFLVLCTHAPSASTLLLCAPPGCHEDPK